MGLKKDFFLFFLEVFKRTLEQIEDTFEPIHTADLIQECVKRIFLQLRGSLCSNHFFPVSIRL
jgi:hypothetical protein